MNTMLPEKLRSSAAFHSVQSSRFRNRVTLAGLLLAVFLFLSGTARANPYRNLRNGVTFQIVNSCP